MVGWLHHGWRNAFGDTQAELLQTLEPSISRVKPLFPGTTCFPLSATKKDKNKAEMLEREFKQETHQLEKIFEVTGTPAVEDIAWMEEGSMKTVFVRERFHRSSFCISSGSSRRTSTACFLRRRRTRSTS